MFKNYFKIGYRNLVTNKVYSLINIGGLATGMAVALLIGLWTYNELTFDKNFSNYNRIARVLQNQNFEGQTQTWFSQAMQLGPELRNNYGDNFEHVVIGGFPEEFRLAHKDRRITKLGCYMEPAITEMLALKIISGTRAGLNEVNSILLSQSTAKALFADTNPIDEVISINNNLDVKVTGIYEDLPHNSSFADLNVIIPWELIVKTADLNNRVGWGNSWFQCFVQIAPNTDMQTVSSNIKDAKLKNVQDSDSGKKHNPQLFLHPMSQWHLYSDFENGLSSGGNIKYVWMLGTIGCFVLFLACINFMNLSTARSEKRAKEVGIRKTMGSIRTQLINQFFTESLLVAFIALMIAILIVELALPWFNEVSGKQIDILWKSPAFWFACVAFTLFTGLTAGSYPALYLSSFQPIKVLKGTFRAGRHASMPRKVLVVFQFTVSVTLIIGTIVIFKQIQYAQNRPIGYDPRGFLSVPIRTDELMKRFDVLCDELMRTTFVEQVAASETAVTETYTTNSGFEWAGKDPAMAEEFVTVGVSHDFGKAVGWHITQGRDFSKELVSDSSGFIINEAAAGYLGFKDALGETIQWSDNGEWKIIGVVKNMVTQSPYDNVKPMIFFLKSKRLAFIQYGLINIKLRSSANIPKALAAIEPIFKKYDPANAFEYKFADQEFGKKFNNEKRIGKLSLVFTVLAIFISCLGLFGLASFIAEQKTKEIGIRKVLGASVTQLWQMLSKDFVYLVIISCALATPMSMYLMEKWLTQYHYRLTISWHIFAAATLGALFITLLTVSFQSVKAAISNPIKSLRSE
jgi:putative ABC transport system permease protein